MRQSIVFWQLLVKKERWIITYNHVRGEKYTINYGEGKYNHVEGENVENIEFCGESEHSSSCEEETYNHVNMGRKHSISCGEATHSCVERTHSISCGEGTCNHVWGENIQLAVVKKHIHVWSVHIQLVVERENAIMYEEKTFNHLR